ncbi:hypothetical protein [Kitasatospora sp. NPDC017646]|uniref:hypothetical protein n=1 Tax=Kitasatospora sp. NPDC017646 TaxID=3364024 RepID=UPI00378DBA84
MAAPQAHGAQPGEHGGAFGCGAQEGQQDGEQGEAGGRGGGVAEQASGGLLEGVVGELGGQFTAATDGVARWQAVAATACRGGVVLDECEDAGGLGQAPFP